MPRPRTYSLNKNSVKKCKKCGKYKNVAEFGWANKKRGWKQSHCRECQKNKTKRYYKNGIEPINSYLKSHPCVDCGEDDYRVLEFDHVRGEKMFNIGNAWNKSWEEIQVEIEKCEVRCKNCHAIRHYEDGWHGGKNITDDDAIEYYNLQQDISNQTPDWYQSSLF